MYLRGNTATYICSILVVQTASREKVINFCYCTDSIIV